MSRGKKQASVKAASRTSSPVFQGDEEVKETDEQMNIQLKDMKVSDILTGNYAPLMIPLLEIPGSRPLVYVKPAALRAEINEKDEFFVDELEEEYLMFTAEMQDRALRRQDGPH